MSEPKQVKVDNWGIYFLQRLKHFFNRTDYCDLTLQFQDNAQLKVHRLVLSACTEYFELLERTCEMYEECLVMPDDLQADVVVPIVNFMYTGQLEFKMEILERLHATSEIMNMPVLTKLLDSHRPKHKQTHNSYAKRKSIIIPAKASSADTTPTVPAFLKRSHAKAFDKSNIVYRDKKVFQASNKGTGTLKMSNGVLYRPPSPVPLEAIVKVKTQKFVSGEPRPTRYELPEELDKDNLFENSFCNISYTSQPLMVHPETTKQYAKRPKQDKGQASTSKKLRNTLDIVECKKIEKDPDNLFEESASDMITDEAEMFKPAFVNHIIKTEPAKDPNKLFDQLLDQNEAHSAKVTIETTKNNKAGANLDHAKIISEVLKKYPHLVKSNKNIKLKIFNNPTPSKGSGKKQKVSPQPLVDKAANVKAEDISDYTFETDVLDSKKAAKLIALGAENIEGPWICLICGTPGKALHFTSYYKFRRHLVEVHNEKPVHNICEFCGQRLSKRNHLLYHMYTKHNVEPPPAYHFPKCSQCSYVALTEALLVKHKLSHTEDKNFRCNVCPSSFYSSSQLLSHIQNTGHKYIADRKHSHQCIYCLRVFVRENNLYAHLKTHHKSDAIKDGIIDESDDESKEVLNVVKHEPQHEQQNDYDDNNMEYHIQQKPDGNIQLVKKKPKGQTILNSGLNDEIPKPPPLTAKVSRTSHNIHTEHVQEEDFSEGEEIVMIDNTEYIMSGNQLILRKPTNEPTGEFIMSDIIQEQPATNSQSMSTSTTVEYATILNSNENSEQASIILKDTGNLSESIPIYVSTEEEYKALMTTNHNIIFDSSDASKTLTVLTTPEAATLNTTQNNDMMIIQNEYPLNVSQAVATDNSNIVVVYSQQVGDTNKEYQLLTTQALGPQYAQTSAILTHNYETVSTSSPVMSAHILEPQVTTWQGDIEQNINNQQDCSSAVLHTVVQDEEVPALNVPDSTNEMSELPQVQLIPITEPATIIPCNNNSNDPPAESLQHNEEVELTHDTQNISTEPHTSLVAPEEEESQTFTQESISENVEDSQELANETDTIQQSDSQEVEHIIAVSDNLPEVEQQSEVIIIEAQSSDTNDNAITLAVQNENMDIQNSDTNENIINMDDHNSDTNENIISIVVQNSDANENTEESITEIVNEANVEPVCSESELNAKAVGEIHSFTSEWTEDDAETTPTPTQETSIETKNQVNTDSVINPEDLEESIENIQQELENQIIKTTVTVDEVETADDVDSLKIPDLPLEEDKPETSKTVDTQVKISSLLTDWDDNDSHEEEMDEDTKVSTEPIKDVTEDTNPDAVSTVVIEQEVNTLSSEATVSQTETTSTMDDDEVIEDTPTDPETNESPSEMEKTKQDNVKSLVSDWDDEEEIKE